MNMEQEYKYFAFISYNSKDTEWGKRVQRKLETYRMPATLCNEHGWNRTPIKPVFFAPTDIQPGGLTEELQERLRASRNLIVICSPNSAKSNWVGKEIEFFHQLGRTKQIHFFIVEGTPNSGNPETECFNPIISTLGLPEILGANIHEKIFRWPWMNKERAFVQLISKLLGVEFDTIWQRHKRLLIQKAIAWTIGIIAVTVALAVVWLHNKPVDVEIRLDEISARNNQLPPLKDAVITMTLENETKEDTIQNIGTTALFPNVPHKYLKKEVRIKVICMNYLPIDTMIVLSDDMNIPIRRDEKAFGRVRLQLWDINAETFVEGIEVSVDGQKSISDQNGYAEFYVPLERQKPVYHVESSVALQHDSIEPWVEGCSIPTLLLKE